MERAAHTLLEKHPGTRFLFFGAAPANGRGLPGPLLETSRFTGSERSAGEVSVEAIRGAVSACLEGRADVLVTGPVSKPALHAAGVNFPGQTEFLQSLAQAPVVGMLMHSERTRGGGPPLRVLLATTHLALRDVPAALTADRLEAQIRLLDRSLREGWGMALPRIALCALNPHAGDGGLFGDEELRIMAPLVAKLGAEGIGISGPFPADTVFLRALAAEADAVVAPYHDVGMAGFKSLAFGSGVNVTLGLPFPRSSPDHGTAFDIAGTGTADATSTFEAMRLALRLAP